MLRALSDTSRTRQWTAALVTALVALVLVVAVGKPLAHELGYSVLAVEVLALAAWQIRRAWGDRRIETQGDTDVVRRRVAAHLVDWLALGLVWIAGQWLAFEVAWRTHLRPNDYQAFVGHETTAAWLLLGANWIVLQAATGFTVGKRLLGIRTVDERGRSPGLRRAIVRSLPLLIEQFGLVALWAMSRGDRHQRYGDRWAHTYVVSIKPKPPRREGTQRSARRGKTFEPDDPRGGWR